MLENAWREHVSAPGPINARPNGCLLCPASNICQRLAVQWLVQAANMILEISERCRSWLDEPTLMWDVQGPGVSFIVVHAGFYASRGREFQDCSLLVGFGEFF